MKEWKISRADAGQPLKKFCMKYLKLAPASFTYKMLRKKNIVLNGKKASGDEVLSEGDAVRFFLSDETLETFTGKPVAETNDRSGQKKLSASDILFQNKDFLIMNKPAGLLSQKAEEKDISANELVRAYLNIDEDAVFRPSSVNRLDRNTSGILLFGLTVQGAAVLSEMLRERKIEKYYTAIVSGECTLQGEYTAFLKKNPATNQVTLSDRGPGTMIQNRIVSLSYDKYNDITVLRIQLITGKTHQIRAGLAHLGYPIVGDIKYGSGSPGGPKAKRQLLHAEMLRFPEDKRLGELAGKEIHAPLPEDMRKYLPDEQL